MFKLYRRRFGVTPVAVTGNAPQPDVKGLVGLDKPKIPSGSDTYPLDVAAALTADRKTLTVAIVNPTESEQRLDVAFQRRGLAAKGQALPHRVRGPESSESARQAAGGGHRGERGDRGPAQPGNPQAERQPLRTAGAVARFATAHEAR